ncbi:YraN family protein [Raoultibacter phocaeensis]|uniref:YraN family protein n=1 Tax=Raoultibacter phocaeensis TaxID=2479841 RepID=UPI001119D6E0|nr:YraN family protein [Raoultibacter phocaeensis]
MSPTMTMEKERRCAAKDGDRDGFRIPPIERPVCEELDSRGREAAARFLERRGYEVVAKNWTCAAGVADIVAMDGDDCIVFVEVNVGCGAEQGMPREGSGEAERDRRERVAALYLQDSEVVDVLMRFDTVSIDVLSHEKAVIRHHINAFDSCRCCCPMSA